MPQTLPEARRATQIEQAGACRLLTSDEVIEHIHLAGLSYERALRAQPDLLAPDLEQAMRDLAKGAIITKGGRRVNPEDFFYERQDA